MPRTKKETVEKALETPDRFRMGEMGYLGLNIYNGVTAEELKRELNFPQSVNTFKTMSYHSTINAALTLYNNLIGKVKWRFVPPVDASEKEKNQAKLINEMMNDMEHTWPEFIAEALSAQVFGFSIHEKVYRRRLKSNGSKYDDGVIGWKKLPIRNQESIEKFIFSGDGNEIIAVKQNLSRIIDLYNQYTSRSNPEVIIPRSKYIHFRVGQHKGDPFGKSPLRDAYTAWKYLTIIEEIEANGVAKDLVGLPVLKLPAQYLAADAPPEFKAIRAYYENVLRNLQLNQQSALMLPNIFDPETKESLFTLELLSLDGKKGMDTSKVKEYYKNLILTSLFADILVMGQGATGSFALGQIKNSMSGQAAETLLLSLIETLNRDLIRQTYELNGWDISRMGSFDFDNLEADDLETESKYWQRVASVGLVEVDRAVLNRIRSVGGVDTLPDDMEVQTDVLSGNGSRAGDGMATAGDGTSTNPNGSDSTSNNLDNKA